MNIRTISNESELSTIEAAWPSDLKGLNINYCNKIISLPALPDELITLSVKNCSGIASFPVLPAGLTTLEIKSCPRLAALPDLPTSLTTLEIKSCLRLTALPDLPTSLTTLEIKSCPRLTALPDLPTSLTTLNISWCTGLTSLPALPASLSTLYLDRCSKIISLPALPASLIALNMDDCSELTSLPALPAGLRSLNIRDCSRLTILPALPKSLITLHMTGCSELQSLLAWPDSLVTLNMTGCSKLISPPVWPVGLKSLCINWCYRLTSLPTFPSGLITLNMVGCSRLTVLPAFPAHLISLNMHGCSELTVLPDLPTSLLLLNLEGCSSLRLTPELSAQLQKLEAAGCEIRYPDHFMMDSQSQILQNRLADAIQASSLQPKPVHIQKLLHRFLSESLGQRGGIHELCAMVEPIVAFLESSPQHLAWADNIASGFLDGCVNQPVRGWSEIASWMYVAQAPDIESQIEAVRYPLTLRSIEELIAKESPGQNAEVEGANALLSQSYAQLQSTMDITRPWPCIPQGIAYEGMITSWLTKDKVSSIVKKVQDFSLEDLAQSVSNTAYSPLWGDIAFPEHIKAIHYKYEQLMENYESLIRLRAGASMDRVLSELESNERREEFKNFQVDMDSVDISELKKHCETLPNKREEEVATTIATLTKEGFEKIGSEKNVAHSALIAFSQIPTESEETPAPSIIGLKRKAT